METIVTEQILRRYFKSKLPSAIKYLIKPGDQVRDYRENSKRWDGPSTVIKISNKNISVTGRKNVK